MTISTNQGQISQFGTATKTEQPETSRWTQTIVVALPPPSLDPQHVAEAALPYARLLAERTGAAVTLVSVIDLMPKFNPLTRSLDAPSATVETQLVTEAQAHVSGLADTFPTRNVDTIVRVGGATAEILAVVNEREQPLLVLSSHTRSGLDRLLFGGVTLDLVRTAPCPVLVVRGLRPTAPAEVTTLAKVVAPLDQSSLAEHALTAALDSLGPADLHLHLLHVVEPLPYARVAPTDLVALVEPEASGYLQEIAQPLLARGYRITTEVRYGNPAEAIAQVAAEQDADLIALATHGRSGFHRILLGSVAEHLLCASPVPLLLVRPASIGRTAHDTEAVLPTVAHRREPVPGPPALWKRRVRELMVQPVVVAHQATPLEQVAVAMVQNRMGCVPIIGERGQLVGIVTESDFLRADPSVPLAAYQVLQLFRERVSPEAVEQIYQAGRELTAGQVMSRPVTTVTEDEAVGVVARLLLERGFNQVPVVREGMPVGIVARHDLLQLLFPAGDTEGGATSGNG